MYGVLGLLAVDCVAAFFLNDSVLQRKEAGKSMFSRRPLGTGEVIEYCSEHLLYSDTCIRKHLKKTYEEDVIAVTIGQFLKRTFKISEHNYK